MDLGGGGEPRRLTYSGNYNTNPAFSPVRNRIAYQSREDGRFNIYVIGLDGGDPVRLTEGEGSNESPSWSPNGRYIVFSSTRSGRARLFLMQVETGKIISALLEDKGDDTSPVWSWWAIGIEPRFWPGPRWPSSRRCPLSGSPDARRRKKPACRAPAPRTQTSSGNERAPRQLAQQVAEGRRL